jgi:putative transposase
MLILLNWKRLETALVERAGALSVLVGMPALGVGHAQPAQPLGLRANLVRHAEDWRWSSLWQALHPADAQVPLAAWPVPRPRTWTQYVNQAQTEAELAALRRAVVRGTPYGEDGWVGRTSRRLALESTLRPRGRPKKKPTAAQ